MQNSLSIICRRLFRMFRFLSGGVKEGFGPQIEGRLIFVIGHCWRRQGTAR